MMKLNSLARGRIIGPEGGAEDSAAGAGVGDGVAGVDVLVVSSSHLLLKVSSRLIGFCSFLTHPTDQLAEALEVT
jgi:hypothetical protein